MADGERERYRQQRELFMSTAWLVRAAWGVSDPSLKELMGETTDEDIANIIGDTQAKNEALDAALKKQADRKKESP